MTNKEIVQEAVIIAKRHGYEMPKHLLNPYFQLPSEDYKAYMEDYYVKSIIFSKEFCKAFWGEEYLYENQNELSDNRTSWQYHLQKMVLEDDPVSYIKKWLQINNNRKVEKEIER